MASPNSIVPVFLSTSEGDVNPFVPEVECIIPDDEMYVCNLCQKVLKGKESYEAHQRIHNVDKPFVCFLCEKKFILEKTLKKHLKSHISESEDENSVDDPAMNKYSDVEVEHACNICLKEFSSEKELFMHKCVKGMCISVEEKFMCGVCFEVFANRSLLDMHQCFGNSEANEQHSDIAYMNAEINSSYIDNGKMLNNQNPTSTVHIESEPKFFMCDKCDKKFLLKETLKRHRLIHNGRKPSSGPLDPKELSERIQKIVADNNKILSATSIKGFIKKDSPLNLHHFLAAPVGEEEPYFFPEFIKSQRMPNVGKLAVKSSAADAPDVRKVEKPFRCDICGERFILRLTLRQHRRSHFKKNKRSANRGNMENSLSLIADCNHAEKDPNCEACLKTFLEDSTLNSRKLMDRLEKPFVCDICGKRFPLRAKLKEHYQAHRRVNEKPHSCDVCGRAFKMKSSLIEHHNLHTGAKPFECEDCGKCFHRKTTLVVHRRIHTGVRNFECGLCQKIFFTPSHFAEHQRTHSGEKPFQCHLCSYRCSRQEQLNNHLRVHNGEKPFECLICDGKFTSKGQLKKHVTVHTGGKRILCDICGKGYGPAYIESHKRIHTGEKPFDCNICLKAFSDKSALRTHMRIHTGEKPYVCKFCNKAFTQNHSLRSHLAIHTGELNLECYLCHKKFGRGDCLRKHLRTHGAFARSMSLSDETVS